MKKTDNSDEIAVEASFEVVGKEEDWQMVDRGDFKGMKSVVDKNTGIFQSLSSEDTRDVDRWQVMPSLEEHILLRELNLYKNRYIRELHPSVSCLSNLEVLSLVRCERLTKLPDDIGNLRNLRELDLMDVSEISFLPDAIGGLSK
jgi:Leucine-rich repeat (LRR) protein